ncbi:hypothetical protein AZE31_13720 [Paenibacillus polymyxa]|nr:hypothetical protein AZE31_13720 [Paenibacillus polymyxa]
MKHTPTIRAELDRYLKQEGMSLTQFGHIAGMSRGIVSAIVTGNKSMSVNQIDRITEAMGLPEGYFYDLFIEKYIIDTAPNCTGSPSRCERPVRSRLFAWQRLWRTSIQSIRCRYVR